MYMSPRKSRRGALGLMGAVRNTALWINLILKESTAESNWPLVIIAVFRSMWLFDPTLKQSFFSILLPPLCSIVLPF